MKACVRPVMVVAEVTEASRTGAREECGVVGVYAPGEDVAKLCYFSLYALQHRGQESAGLAVSDGTDVVVTKEMGLVNQAFDEATLASFRGHLGIGHVRYSTTGASTWDNAQPAFKVTRDGTGIALGHNGNLTNTAELSRELAHADGSVDGAGATDSEVVTSLLTREAGSLEEALLAVCDRLVGAYSMVVMDGTAVYGVRDPHGIRPLVLGQLPRGGYVLASETTALDIVGAVYLRDVAPGELVAIDERGLRAHQFAEAQPNFCVFEYVYLARPDHRTDHTSVAAARQRMGAALAAEAPVDADLVVPVPDSGTQAAAGYAEASGIPYAEGLVKNRYVGRTFIEPSPSVRELGIRLKLNPLRDVLAGKRLVVVDDSIVRGNTSRQLVSMLYESGAAEVHLRITSPPVRHPCFYGIDMATRGQLVAAGRGVDEVRDYVSADSLAYLSLEGLVAATGERMDQLCRACFDGQYPVAIPLTAAEDGTRPLTPAGR